MNNITFEFNKLSREGDKLLQILNYYPKISKIDKFQIKNIPKISISDLSELKALDYSLLYPRKNINDISQNINRNEIKGMAENLLYSIIDNIIEKYNNKNRGG